MNLISDEFVNTVAALISKVTPSNCDAAEYSLAKAFDALPICFSLWSYTLLTARGEVIRASLNDDNEPQEESRFANSQGILSALRVGVGRYQELGKLLPSRSPESLTCPMCDGNRKLNPWGKPPEKIACLLCKGWGWVLPEP